MMFVITDAFNVIPRRGLVAAITLIDPHGAAAFGYAPIFLLSDGL